MSLSDAKDLIAHCKQQGVSQFSGFGMAFSIGEQIRHKIVQEKTPAQIEDEMLFGNIGGE